jgi:hypothetical protein
MCFVCISEQTLTFVRCNVKREVFISEVDRVYCMEQPGSLKKTDYISSLKVKEFVMFHNDPIKGHVKLFMCPPVILQIILLIVPHLINNFLNSHVSSGD